MSRSFIQPRGRRFVRSLFIYGAASLILAICGRLLSGGLPWGVDDGVKRLMARQWVASGAGDLTLPESDSSVMAGRFYPVPPPFAEETKTGIRGVFPALYPIIGGGVYAIFGSFGWYILPALCLTTLWVAAVKLCDGLSEKRVRIWAMTLIVSPLLFYGLTFWEHPLALLCLLPLFFTVREASVVARSWVTAGFFAGAAVYLRVETILILPFLLIAAPEDVRTAAKRFGYFALGMIPAGVLAVGVEKVWAGRWIPAQIGVNLSLCGDFFQVAGRGERILSFLFNAPIPWVGYAAGIGGIALLSLILRNSFLFFLGFPILSLTVHLYGLIHYGAFGMTAFSQGLFLALPWIVVSLAKIEGERRGADPFLIAGWGFIALFYLIAPDQPGMHWGPRFLLPALIPLWLRVVRVFSHWNRRKARWVLLASGIAALLTAGSGAAALGQRGAAGSKVKAMIQSYRTPILIVDQWTAGADLEPLWGANADGGRGGFELVRVAGAGDLEELLILLQEREQGGAVGWLKQRGDLRIEEYPLVMEARMPLPGKAGWKGEFFRGHLAESGDPRWGGLYRHAGRRRAEKSDLAEALFYYRKALKVLPEDADLHYDSALCLGKMGRIPEAEQELLETLRIQPDHKPARELWGKLRSVP